MTDTIRMNATAYVRSNPLMRIHMRQPESPQVQRGVVLLITLIVLAIISLLAITSVRNASSSESVSGNVRLTELATQASELALRHCERSLLDLLTTGSGGSSTYTTTFVQANLLEPPPQTDPPQPQHWQRADKWDSNDAITASGSTPADVYVLPLALLNQASLSKVTYQRPPECVVEKMVVMLGGGGATVPPKESTNTSFLITARGFGPEVAPADSNRDRPIGSEIWLQSQLIFNH